MGMMMQGSAVPDVSARLEGFADFVRDIMAAWKVPGLAVAAVEDGQVIVSQGFGLRDVSGGPEVTPRTLFAIGSCTKAFTAMGLAILADEGKLDWDAPVRTYLPAFRMHDVVASERMTPRDLVTHRSGLPRHDKVWYCSSLSRRELFERLRYLEPSKDFRSVWQYQNLMFMTAGYLVGEIAGQSWEEFTRARILDPLGMSASNFSVKISKQQPDHALPHKEEDEKVVAIPFCNIDSIGPAGSINSNVEDMARWLLLNLNKGRHGDSRIVSEAQLAQMHAPQMVMPDPLAGKYPELSNLIAYGLGWCLQPYRGHTLIWHTGGIDGFTSIVVLLPDENAGIVVLNNISSSLPRILALNLCDRLLGLVEIPWSDRFKSVVDEAKETTQKAKEQSASGRIAGTQPSHSLQDYVGEFEHPAYGVVSLRLEGERLMGRRDDLTFSLDHYHYDIFELTLFGESEERLKLSFTTNVKGDIDGFTAPFEPTAADIPFKRRPAQEMREKSFLERFVGVYELAGVNLTISLKGENTLQASLPGQPDYELVPYKDTEFTVKGLSGFSVSFKADASSAVMAAVITQPNGVFTATKKAGAST
jgi:CubicO group peptidase (beta-lactamase class C family)